MAVVTVLAEVELQLKEFTMEQISEYLIDKGFIVHETQSEMFGYHKHDFDTCDLKAELESRGLIIYDDVSERNEDIDTDEFKAIIREEGNLIIPLFKQGTLITEQVETEIQELLKREGALKSLNILGKINNRQWAK